MPGLPNRDYIKSHLLDYVRFQLQQGYDLDSIKSVLLKFGYHASLVEEICHMMAPGDYPGRRPAEQKDAHEMDSSLKFYVKNMLIDYIVKEQKLGYSTPAIRKALMSLGHNPQTVDAAIRTIEKGEAVDFQTARMIQVNIHVLFAVSVFLYFVFIVFMSISTNSDLTRVLYSFMPAAVAIIIVFAACIWTKNIRTRQLLPFFGIIIALLAFIGAAQLADVIPSLPGSNIVLIINVVMAFILSSVFCFFSKVNDDEILEKAHTHRKIKPGNSTYYS